MWNNRAKEQCLYYSITASAHLFYILMLSTLSLFLIHSLTAVDLIDDA